MPSFTTVDDQIARRFRVAHLTGRLISGSTSGHTFAKARIKSVRRDLAAAVPCWTIDIEDDGTEAG